MYLSKIEVQKKEYWKWILVCLLFAMALNYISYAYQLQDKLLFWFFDALSSVINPANVSVIKQYTVFVFYLCAFIVISRYVLNVDVRSFISIRRNPRWFILILGGSLFGFCYFVLIALEVFFQYYRFNLDVDIVNFLQLFFISFIFIPIKVLFSELFLRAFITKILSFVVKKKLLIILLSAVIYVLYQCSKLNFTGLSFPLLFYLFFMGLMFVVLLFLTDGIELSLGMLFFNNFIVTIFISQKWYDTQTAALLTNSSPKLNPFLNIYLPMLLFTVYVIFVVRAFRINNWKERILGTLN